jgi:hypothetical protein
MKVGVGKDVFEGKTLFHCKNSFAFILLGMPWETDPRLLR